MQQILLAILTKSFFTLFILFHFEIFFSPFPLFFLICTISSFCHELFYLSLWFILIENCHHPSSFERNDCAFCWFYMIISNLTVVFLQCYFHIHYRFVFLTTDLIFYPIVLFSRSYWFYILPFSLISYKFFQQDFSHNPQIYNSNCYSHH